MNHADTHPRIGPNAIIQVAEALQRQLGREPAGVLFAAVGMSAYLESPPQHMVDEREVIALHAAVRERLPAATAHEIAQAAGLATGDYLLANRIPALVRSVLEVLPAPLASRLLLAAIGKHSWTFAGSGHFASLAGHPVVVTIGDCPICRGAHAHGPVCNYYAATFERLFARLVHRRATVTETECIAAGAPACRFEISWG
jgi:divinyl protochlorophyllide a 8-vinyl-reductase